VRLLLAERDALRESRDFPKADAIYANLKGMGLVLNDKKKTWKRSS
jgi:cysteinyl-tRNA synthetase